MLTKCPHCHTVFQLSDKQLERAQGQVRCGHCQFVFAAKQYLYNQAVPDTPVTKTEVAKTKTKEPPPAHKVKTKAKKTKGRGKHKAKRGPKDAGSAKPRGPAPPKPQPNAAADDDDTQLLPVNIPGSASLIRRAPVDTRHNTRVQAHGAAASATPACQPQAPAAVHTAPAQQSEAAASAVPQPALEEPAQDTLAPAAAEAEPAAEFINPPEIPPLDPEPSSGSLYSLSEAAVQQMQTAPRPAALPATPEKIPEAFPEAMEQELLDTGKPETLPAMIAWTVASIVLLMLLPLQYIYFEREMLARDNDWRPFLNSMCAVMNCTLPLQANTKALSSDATVKESKEYDNVLEVTFLFKNEADHYQPYPRVQFALTDTTDKPVATRQFEPAEYLDPGIDIEQGMAPGAEVRMQMEFISPDKPVFGYEFKFL